MGLDNIDFATTALKTFYEKQNKSNRNDRNEVYSSTTRKHSRTRSRSRSRSQSARASTRPQSIEDLLKILMGR